LPDGARRQTIRVPGADRMAGEVDPFSCSVKPTLGKKRAVGVPPKEDPSQKVVVCVVKCLE